jgi:uncharacterized protein
MKFHLGNNMIKNTFHSLLGTFLFIFLLASGNLQGQDSDIPDKPNPPRLVNDFAGFLSAEENNQLEQKLVAYYDSTTTQIAVIIVKSLNGYDISDMATRIGKKWSIGEAGKNNGILILVKPKIDNENGKVWIATGYGTESSVPDVICKRIVEYEILPAFKEGQNYLGLNKATNTIYSLLRNEFTPNQYLDKHKSKKKSNFPIAIIVVIIVVVIISSRKNSSNSNHLSSGSSLPFWMLLGAMNSGRHNGSFGDFSSGGGDFGGGGGFGGFGGGDFGGGGAGGSW